MQTDFRHKFNKVILPALMKELGIVNLMAAPRIEKITLNVGISASNKDPKLSETVSSTLERISGQKPVATVAKQSIASFKTRAGMVVGMKVTLRGMRMYDFLEKFVNVALPRVRDFRGLPLKSVDRNGNLSVGFKEHIAFPEIRPDEVERIHGIEVVFTAKTKNRDEGLALWKAIGFPFQAKESAKK
jgi:large subunit ribosomal protein L5